MASREQRNYAAMFSFPGLAMRSSPARAQRFLKGVTVSNFDFLSFFKSGIPLG